MIDQKIKYLYLIFTQPDTLAGKKARIKHIMNFLDCDDTLDFCAKFVKSGSYLYGEYMKYRTEEIKSKINE